jgi:hypothetical protein
MAVLWVYFPVEWFREHWMRHWNVPVSSAPVLELGDEEPMRIIHLSSGRTAPSSSTVALRGRAIEPEVEEEPPPEPELPQAAGAIDFSYDPFSSGFATSELLLQAPDQAKLREAALLRSLSLAGDFSFADIDSNDIAWLAMRFSDMQHDFILDRSGQWSAEARAIWMERHELWKKLYGDDEEWP